MVNHPGKKGWEVRVRTGLAGVWGLVFGLALFTPSVHAQQARTDAGKYLQQMTQLAEQALAASRAAEQASSVDALKAQTNEVFETVWGVPAQLQVDPEGDVPVHGWKTQWQVSGAEFDSSFAARYGTEPPPITDPEKLGIEGRGRFLRKHLDAIAESENVSDAEREQARRIVASLNNVIGWMRMDDGVTKGERQPRVDLTREWDAPSEFWLSTADTGWLFEAYSQAANILKTDYDGDLAMARRHAADMTRLIEKYLNGVDADKDGVVEPVQMEGGLYTALREAQSAGLVSR